MYDKIKQVMELREKLNTLRPFTTGEMMRLKEEFMIEYTYDSNAIEGSTLTLSEIALVLKENITIAEKPLHFHLAAIGHRNAYYYIEELVQQKKELTGNKILNIHSLVLMDRPDDKGKYRNIPVRILGTDAVLAESYMIKPKMEELFNWYKDSDKNIIEKIANFSFEV